MGRYGEDGGGQALSLPEYEPGGTGLLGAKVEIPIVPVAIAKKLALVAAEIGRVAADCEHPTQHWKFASHTAVMTEVHNALNKHQVAVIPRFEILERMTWGTMGVGISMRVHLVCVDSDSGEQVTLEGYGTGYDRGDKALAKATTMAVKYCWLTALHIPHGGEDVETDEDTDGEMEEDRSNFRRDPVNNAPRRETREQPPARPASAVRQPQEPLKPPQPEPVPDSDIEDALATLGTNPDASAFAAVLADFLGWARAKRLSPADIQRLTIAVFAASRTMDQLATMAAEVGKWTASGRMPDAMRTRIASAYNAAVARISAQTMGPPPPVDGAQTVPATPPAPAEPQPEPAQVAATPAAVPADPPQPVQKPLLVEESPDVAANIRKAIDAAKANADIVTCSQSIIQAAQQGKITDATKVAMIRELKERQKALRAGGVS